MHTYTYTYTYMHRHILLVYSHLRISASARCLWLPLAPLPACRFVCEFVCKQAGAICPLCLRASTCFPSPPRAKLSSACCVSVCVRTHACLYADGKEWMGQVTSQGEAADELMVHGAAELLGQVSPPRIAQRVTRCLALCPVCLSNSSSLFEVGGCIDICMYVCVCVCI